MKFLCFLLSSLLLLATHVAGSSAIHDGQDVSTTNLRGSGTLTHDTRTFMKGGGDRLSPYLHAELNVTPKRKVQMSVMDQKLVEDSRTFIKARNLLGVITMDEDSAKALKAALESSFELTQHLGKWYNDEPVNTSYLQYLVLLQDPVDHLVASWNRHLDNYTRKGSTQADGQDLQTQFYKCFPNLEEFAYSGLNLHDLDDHALYGLDVAKDPDDCQKLASRVAHADTASRDFFFGEFYYHHAHHFQEAILDANKPVYVIRQEDEHIISDVHRVYDMVLGHQSPFQLKVRTLPAPELTLSLEALYNLCRVLCNDIQVYKRVIQQSMNLGDYAYSQAQAHLATTCPVQAMEDSCPSVS
jgi:hypothetical protein